MKKLQKIILWIFLGCLLLAITGFTALSIWAITGPRDISAYSDYIEKSINGTLENNHIVIGKTYIEWDGLDGRLSVRATDVVVYNNSQQKIATFPKIILKYGLRSLFSGYLIPSRLKLIEPVIDLSSLVHRGDDPGFDFQDLNLGRLDKVSIVNGKLIAPDQEPWNISKATLWYSGGNIRVETAVNRPNGETIEASLKTNTNQSDGIIRASFANFNTLNLVPFFPEIEKAQYIVNGRASYSFRPKEKVASFDIDNISGEFNDPERFKYKHKMQSGKISGQYDVNNEILDIKHLEATYRDGFKLSGKGLITSLNRFDIQANFANLKIANLKVYWPNLAPVDTITWINEHVKGGIVTDGTLKLQISPEEIATGKLNEKAIDLKFNFKDISASYFKDLMPISNGAGSAVMDSNSVMMSGAATAGNSRMTKSSVEIYDIGTPIEKIAVNAEVEGTAEDLADFYLKLHKGRQLIKTKSDVSGKAVSSIKVRLPLLKALDIEDVNYNIKTEISEAAIKGMLDKLDIDKLKLSLTANNNSYNAQGSCMASYNQANENFTLKNAPARFEVTAKNDDLKIAAVADVADSSFEFVPLEIKKPAGEPGRLHFEILDNSNVAILNKFNFDSKPVRIVARGNLKKDYSDFLNLQLDDIEIGETKLMGRVTKAPYLTAEFKGPYFDARPLIRYLNKDEDQEDESEFKILLKADTVALLNEQTFSNAYVTLHCAKDCDVISINSNELSFNQTSATLAAEAENAGNVLKAFDLYTNMIGGKLEIKAKVNGSLYNGKVSLTDFNIVKARILAKMLTLGSLTGIADLALGNGIRFRKLTSDFELDKHRIKVKDYRMVGPAIGITANGEIDRDRDLANISGNIIPAYTANTLLGHIPLIGDVIIGDEGVFALAYTLKGNIDDPKIFVNPLSVLAPGFLKNVFQ